MNEEENSKRFDLEDRAFVFAKRVRAFIKTLSKTISWALAFPPLRYNAYAYHVQMTFGGIFAVMTWIGPLTATGASSRRISHL